MDHRGNRHLWIMLLCSSDAYVIATHHIFKKAFAEMRQSLESRGVRWR